MLKRYKRSADYTVVLQVPRKPNLQREDYDEAFWMVESYAKDVGIGENKREALEACDMALDQRLDAQYGK